MCRHGKRRRRVSHHLFGLDIFGFVVGLVMRCVTSLSQKKVLWETEVPGSSEEILEATNNDDNFGSNKSE
jgi:hypothetical protein